MKVKSFVALAVVAAVPAAAALLGSTLGDAVSGRPGVVEMAAAPPLEPYDAPPQFPGWPKTIPAAEGFVPNDNPTLYDLDGDGDLEVLVGTTAGYVYIWDHDGKAFPGWPKGCSPYCQSGPAVGDIDGDEKVEIVAFSRGTTRGGMIYAWETSGSIVSGFPKSIGGYNPSHSPSLRDMDKDGDLEIIVGVRRYPVGDLYILNGDGSPWPGWPKELDRVPSTTAATGDLDGDGDLELVYTSYHSLYAFEKDGKVMPGWPFSGEGSFSSSAPALCDFDKDGDLEVVCPVDRGDIVRMYVLHHDGKVASGWPVDLQHPHCFGSPSIGDVDSDGEMEIVIGDDNLNMSEDTATLYCWNFDGSSVPGWPVTVPYSWWICGSPIIADLDGDARVEIVTCSNVYERGTGLGWLHGYNHDGTPMEGWPLRPKGWTAFNTGAVADVDGDGDIDLCNLSHDDAGRAYVYLWDLAAKWNRRLDYWPMYHHDVWHTGEVGLDVPIGVEGADFRAAGVPAGVRLSWNDPGRAVGSRYNLYRKAAADEVTEYVQVNAEPIVGRGPYDYLDRDVQAGKAYRYLLKVTTLRGATVQYGPVEVRAGGTRPAAFGLAARPNPNRGAIAFTFSLPAAGPATIALYDLAGRRVATVFDGVANAGENEVAAALRLAPGVYVSRLEAGGGVAAKRLVVAR
ncbi:MAG: T9SS type A sorting domain-containing protein [candidate division Zixibacteria bacterium]|nr:T9SS type A sorting domain-containing protein [candidate division Zixibacteria bacterium]